MPVIELGKGGRGMRSRVTFSIAAAVLLLASTNANGIDVTGSTVDGIFSAPVPACVGSVECAISGGGNTFSWGQPFDTTNSSSALQATGVDPLKTMQGIPVVHVGDLAAPADTIVIGYL